MRHLTWIGYLTTIGVHGDHKGAWIDEDTPAEIVRAIQPDVLVKGADWALDKIIGRDTVEARGGKVVRVPIEQGWSTTAIVEKVVASRK